MTTNREWLDYLAQNAPDELAAWFDAEHVENQERVLDGDTEPENDNTDTVSEQYATAFKWLDRLNYGKGGVVGGSFNDTPEQGEVVMSLESWREHLDTESDNEDSRDKIEADVREIVEAYNMDTQRHGSERFAHELYYSIIHLLDRQAAITKREWCDEQGFWNCAEDAVMLSAQVVQLTAERDELNMQINTMREVIRDYRNERDHYREKFGKCLDYADAIHALMDDEGMA